MGAANCASPAPQADQSAFAGQGAMTPAQEVMGPVQKIMIKEKVSMLEAATALLGQEIEMANKYSVTDGYGNQLFYAVEETDCCTRQLKNCMKDCAPFKVNILNTSGGGSQPGFFMEKGWSFTCCCINRPRVQVKDISSGGEMILGTIHDPCTCLALNFSVYDDDGNPVATADGGCCQWGMCCPFPCGPCAKVEFKLLDGNSNEVGMLTKKIPGFCKFFLSPDVDNYHVDFGDNVDAKTKALFLALAIFMDFQHFSDNSNDSDGGLMGSLGGGGGEE